MKCKRIVIMLLVISMISGLLLMAVPGEKTEDPALQAAETSVVETEAEKTTPAYFAEEPDEADVPAEIPEEPVAAELAMVPSTLTIAGAAETTADGTENYRLYAEEGETISFGPSVLEQGEFAYQWQKLDAETKQYQDITLAENPTAKSAELTVEVDSGDLDREGVYRCVISCGSVSADAVFTITDDIPTCDTADELIELVREQMVNRAKYYTVILTSGELVDNNEIYDRVYEHTGVPVEGDYLKNHSKGVGYSDAVEVDNGMKYIFELSYYTTASQEALMTEIIEDHRSEWQGKTSYDAVVNIFRYIIKNISYDHYHYGNIYDLYGYWTKQTAYGALVDETCVCEGYASLFYRLALEFGCDARLITGVLLGTGPHAWNIVDADGDGTYYLVDTTVIVFLGGEALYGEDGLYRPDLGYLSEEFRSRFPMSYEYYKCEVDHEYDTETATLTIYEDIPHFYEDPNNCTAPWTEEEKQAKKVIISEGVEQVGSLAFEWFSSLETVEMADSVITLGDNAFSSCTSLKEITLSQNLQNIGSYCFYNAGDSNISQYFEIVLPDSVVKIEESAFCVSGLSKIEISENSRLEYIGNLAFDTCMGLTEIFIPASVKRIGAEAFWNCRYLSDVRLADDLSITIIEDGTFAYCTDLEKFTIPEDVQAIGANAFMQCESLEEIIFPANIVSIGESAFECCWSLTGLDFPENLQSIGDRAFFECKISNVHIPEGVEHIGDGVFSHNYIEQITLDANNEAFILEDDVLLTRDMERLVIFPNGSEISSYEIPTGVKTMAEGAFFASQLQSVVLPDTLTEINDSAFSNCRQLETIIIPEGVREIGYAAFASCWKLSEIEIPGSVHTIGDSAFEVCETLEAVSLPEGVIKLGHNAFNSCNKLTTIELPVSLVILGQNAFGDAAGKVILYPGTAEDWERIEDSSYGQYDAIVEFVGSTGTHTVSFDGNGSSNTWDSKTVTTGTIYGELPEPVREGYTFYGWFTSPTGGMEITADSIATIDRDHTLYAHWEDTVSASGTVEGMKWFFHNNGELVVWANGSIPHFEESTMPWSGLRDEIKAITVCEGVTQIGNYAFYGCTNAETLTLPYGLKIIWDFAFRNCTSLKRLEIPHGVTWIGEDAFSSCSALSEIVLPDSLRTIDELAFRFCTSLTSIDLPESLANIYTLAFAYCENLESITIPAGIGYMGDNIFYNCTSLTSATVKGTGVDLGNGLFKQCTALTEVILPDGLPGIGRDTFKHCTALETIRIPDSVTHIGQYAFAECENLKNIELGENLELIDKNAFSGCTSLKTIVLPDGLQTIDTLAFANCTGMTEIEFNEGLRELGHSVFSGCTGLTEVRIPNNIVSLGLRMFMDCTGLKKVTYAPSYDEIPRGTFANCENLEEIYIYSDLRLIDVDAFSGCNVLSKAYWYHTQQDWDDIRIAENNDALTEAELICLGATEFNVNLDPNGGISEVNTIRVSYGMPYGELPEPVREGYRFRGWFTELDGGKEVASYTRVSNPLTHTLYALWWSVDVNGTCGSNLTWQLFGDGTLEISGSGPMQKFTTAPWADVQNQIRSIIICDGVTSICDNAFTSLYGLTDISMASSVASIGQKAFQNCTALQEVKLPEGVVSVGNYAFAQCERLVSVEMPSTCIELGTHIFLECSAMKTAKVFNTGSYMFFFCEKLTDVTIGETVTEIADNAFSYCRAVQMIKLPDSLEKIGAGAFNSAGLKEITLPEGLASIGKEAFRFCGGLQAISIPDSVTEIGAYAFSGCDKLESVKLSENCTYISSNMFSGCASLTEIVLPECVDTIGSYAFSGCYDYTSCTGLTTITMPNVKTIGAYAFMNCKGLKSITIPANVEEIRNSAFYRCEGLKEIVFCGDAVSIQSNPYTGEYDVFNSVVATAYYPDSNETWTEDVRCDYGGTLTWLPWYTMGNNLDCEHVLTSEKVSDSCLDNYILHSCECGYSYRTDFEVTHTYVIDDAVEPNCTEYGRTEGSHCSICGEILVAQEIIPATGHTELTDEGVFATCTENGLTEGSHCSECGEILLEQEIITAVGHQYGDWRAILEPTCSAEGEHFRDCEECGYREVSTIAALDHTVAIDAARRATCTKSGLTEGSHCSVCGETLIAQQVVPALGHTEAARNGVAPSCMETGLTDGSYCSICGETLTAQEEIPALGHSETTDAAKDATCTETGLTEGSHCGTCGKILTEQVEIPALGHLVIVDEALEAGCTTSGLTEGSHCGRCLEVLVMQETVPALGHQWDEGIVIAEPTEQSTGIRAYTCERCDVTKTEITPALEHIHAYTGVTTDPTCVQQGYTTYTCSCGESFIDAFVDALGHSAVTDAGKDATCTASGLTEGSHCSACGQILTVQKEISALGHQWDEGTVTLEPTEETTGIMVYNCEICGATREAELPTVDHVHIYEAVATAPTCTEQGYTTYTCRCGDSYVDDILAATGHDVVMDAAVSAGCTSTGLTEGGHCATCDTVLTAQETVPAFGHQWNEGEETVAPTEYSDGIMTYTCGRCGETKEETIPALEHIHSYEAVVTAPTCTEQGYTTYTCSCGDSYVDDLVDALGHQWDDGTVARAPTEEAEGIRTYTCGRCNGTREETIPVLEHVHNYESVVTAPTCTEQGYTTYTCRCGESYTESIVEALGHTEVTDAAVAPTCTATGLTEGKHCDLCSEILVAQENVDATGHSYSNGTCAACGQGYSTSGSCGEGVSWTFDEETGTLTISGGGTMEDYGTVTTPWEALGYLVKHVVIGEDVVKITADAFVGNDAIETITFTGDAPEMDPNALAGTNAEVYYPAGNSTWSEDDRQDFGGNITWNPVYETEEVIGITADSTVVLAGQKILLTADLYFGDRPDTRIHWNLEDSTWAVLTADGATATIAAGEVTEKQVITVTAYAEGGIAEPATIQITILPLAQSLNILDNAGNDVSGTTVWVDLTQTEQITFYPDTQPEDAQNAVSWQLPENVNDLAEYTVNEDGSLTLIPVGKSGTISILAVTEDGSEKLAELSVKFCTLEIAGEEIPGEDPADVNLLSGKNKTLKIYDADTGKALTNKQVTWSMDEVYAPYAKLDKNGKITAKKVVERVRVEAVATIIGSEGTTVVVTVDIFPAVSSVELLNGEETVNGKTISLDSSAEPLVLTANIYPLDAMEGVSWTVSDKKEAFATYEIVDNVLTITPKADAKAGAVTIKVTSTDGSNKTATVKLQFAAYAKTVTIDKSITTLTAGDKAVQLTAAMEPEVVTKSGIVWSLKNANDKNYVNLSSSGKIIPKAVLAPVDITVVATSKDGMASDEHTIRILPKSGAQLVIKSGDTYVTKTTQTLDVNTREAITLSAFTYGETEMTAVEWSPLTNKTAEITQNADGSLSIRMIAAGSINVTAKAADGRKATVTVKGVKLAQGVEISQKKTNITEGLEVASGKSLDLQAAVADAANKKVTWSIEEGSAYASVSSSGKVTAAKDLTSSHKVVVKAVAADGSNAEDTMELMVRPIAQGVQVYSEAGGQMLFSFRTTNWWVRSNTTLTWDLSTQADSIAMNAHVFPYYGEEDSKNAIQEVTWKSSAPKIAEFVEDAEGNVSLKLHKTGSATITVTAADGSGQKVTFKLNVINTVTELIIADQNVQGGKTLNLAKLVTINPTDATNKKLTWTVTRGGEYATISSSGSFKAKKVTASKQVEVTVSSQDGGASTTFKVTITP